jgi:allantoinase
VCDHHPEIIEEGGKLGWEWIGHNLTNALRLTEMDPAAERGAVRATIDRIEAASGTRPLGWLGAGLAETWNSLGLSGPSRPCPTSDNDAPARMQRLNNVSRVPGSCFLDSGCRWLRPRRQSDII